MLGCAHAGALGSGLAGTKVIAELRARIDISSFMTGIWGRIVMVDSVGNRSDAGAEMKGPTQTR